MTGHGASHRFSPGGGLGKRVQDYVGTLDQAECIEVIALIVDSLVKTSRAVQPETAAAFAMRLSVTRSTRS